MANHIIGIIGKSGTGKSSSLLPDPDFGIEGLDPAETFYINVYSKPLPARGWTKLYNAANKNYAETSKPDEILKIIGHINKNMPHIKQIVIDDYQYTMADEFFSRISEKSYDKFNDIGVGAYKILTSYKGLRNDLMLIVMTHSDDDNEIKTIGKMVNEKLTPPGLMTVVLYADVKMKNNKPEYGFVTNHDGTYPAKSPKGMFPARISNDLGLVVKTVRQYDEGS